MIDINDTVKLCKTNNGRLDGASGRVVGEFGIGYKIVLFDSIPSGYNPAIVISEYYLTGA